MKFRHEHIRQAQWPSTKCNKRKGAQIFGAQEAVAILSTKKIAFLSIAAVCARNRIFCELFRLEPKNDRNKNQSW